MWEEGAIDKRIGKMLYFIKHPKWVIKRHLNQIKKKKRNSRNRSMQGGIDDGDLQYVQCIYVSTNTTESIK